MHLSLQNGETPLMCATRNGDVENVKLLLDRGANFNVADCVSEVTSSSISLGGQFHKFIYNEVTAK